MTPMQWLCAKSNNRTRGQFECGVTWCGFRFDFVCLDVPCGCFSITFLHFEVTQAIIIYYYYYYFYFIIIKNFIYRWYIKIAFANKFQPYHKIQYNIYYVSLHIKHPQSISPIFLILFLNSNNELLDFATAGRLFHIREPRK